MYFVPFVTWFLISSRMLFLPLFVDIILKVTKKTAVQKKQIATYGYK